MTWWESRPLQRAAGGTLSLSSPVPSSRWYLQHKALVILPIAGDGGLN